MYVAEAILASIGLSFDVLAISIREGSLIREIDKKKLAIMCGIFGAIQILAMQLGILLTYIPIFNSPVGELQLLWHTLSGIIFLGIGFYLFSKGFRQEVFVERLQDLSYRKLITIALLTSVDAFFAGISFGILDIRAIISIVMLAIVTIGFVIVGVYIGYRLGYEQKGKAYIVGGLLLFLAGIMFLIHYFG